MPRDKRTASSRQKAPDLSRRSSMRAKPDVLSEFIISFWCAPPAEETTLAPYREIANCGFNLVLTWFHDIPMNRKVLDLCRKAGLKVLIGDFRLFYAAGCAGIRAQPRRVDFRQQGPSGPGRLLPARRAPRGPVPVPRSRQPAPAQERSAASAVHQPVPELRRRTPVGDEDVRGTRGGVHPDRQARARELGSLAALMKDGERDNYFENIEIVRRLA